MDHHAELTKFLRKQLSDLTEEGPITYAELLHTGEGPERIIAGLVKDNSDPEDLATEFYEAATHDADTRTSGIPQRYVIALFRGTEERRELSAQKAFMLDGGATRSKLGILGVDTYKPTEEGERAMSMSQTQAMHKLMFAQTQYMSERALQDTERYRKRLEKLEERAIKQMELMEDLLDRRHERELAAARETQKARNIDKVTSMFMTMAPMLIGGLLGKAVPGMASGARDSALHEFLRSLEPQEIEKILEALPADKQMAVMQLYQAHAQEEAKEQAEKHPLLRDVNEN